MEVRWTVFFLLLLAVVLLCLLPEFSSLAGTSVPAIHNDCLPTPRPTEPCDICEPNNLFDQACGPLGSGQGYRYFVRCTTGVDDDFYYIDLETSGMYTVDLTGIPASTDYSVYLYDDKRQLLKQCSSDERGNTPEHATCELSQPGRYYVRVYPWVGCNDSDPYTLAVTYPTPSPTPIPTNTPTPPCNIHVDDFGDTNPLNDLRKPSGWELDPPGCGDFGVNYTGHELQLDYDLTSPGECTARYTTTLSLNAYPYELLTFEIKGDAIEELSSVVVGLSDMYGHEMRVKVGDFANQLFTGTWQGVGIPLAALATAVDTTKLDTLFIEFSDARGASQGTVYLDSFRLESPLAPLTIDNFNDLAAPNALGGGTGIYGSSGAILESAYIVDGTHDHSPGSYVISYTLPSDERVLWETDLLGLDASDYAFLSFYIKGASGGEKANLYLADGGDREAYVDVEAYAPTGIIGTDWASVRVPLQAFEGVALTDLTRVKFAFEWEPMVGTIFLDDLRFVAVTLLVDNFCDSDENNSHNGEVGTFVSDSAIVTSTFSGGSLRLSYDVSAGSDCYSGYWSKTPFDLNPYRSLVVKVRGERCGQAAVVSARTVPVETDKMSLSDYLFDGITDQWQEVRIPLAASSVVTDWTQGGNYVIAFEAGYGVSKGTTWWDNVAFETDCAPLWVDNFNDEDNFNALRGSSGVFEWEAEIASYISITQAYGDAGAGLVLSYTIPTGRYAGWETELRNVDLSNYDWLVFSIKGAVGGEKPNIYLNDGDGKKRFINIEDYVNVSTEWQTVFIPLQSFYGLDLTRIQALQIIVEWGGTDVEIMLFLDDIRFLPSVSCGQVVAKNLVYMPLIPYGYPLLVLDPVWDFENGTEGWTTYHEITTSRATVAVETSSFRSISGTASLAMTMDLDGDDECRDKGVAYVDVGVPLDLACKPLSCWLYVPTCGLGDPDGPNEVRLFVEDVNGNNEYGTRIPVLRNQWFEVTLRPSTLEPYKGLMEPGFDPSAIVRLGVQFRANDGSVYRGKVYVDACGWQEIDPPSATRIESCQVDKGVERMPP